MKTTALFAAVFLLCGCSDGDAIVLKADQPDQACTDERTGETFMILTDTVRNAQLEPSCVSKPTTKPACPESTANRTRYS